MRRHARRIAFLASCRGQSTSSGQNEPYQRFSKLQAKNPTWRRAFAETLSEQQLAEINTEKRKMHLGGTGASSRRVVVVGISDDIDVSGFSNRYGVNSSLVHTSALADHPFVEWLRHSYGALLIGKIRLTSPFAFTEAINYEVARAAEAVSTGVCDIAVVTSLNGVAGSNGPVVHDVVSFAPSQSAFPRGEPPFSKYRSLALTFPNVSELNAFWEEITIRSANRADSPVWTDGDDIPVPQEQQPDQPSKAATTSPLRWFNNAIRSLRGTVKRSSDKQTDVGGIVIGVPEDWIEACFGAAQPGSGKLFLKEVERLVEQRNLRRSRGSRPSEVREISWSARPDDILACASCITQYELANALKAKHMDGTGLLDQLPAAVVSAIFQGKNIPLLEYLDAVAFRSELSREYLDEVAEVDCALTPVVGPPHVTHSLRSALVTLPVALSRSPSVALRIEMPGLTFAETDPGVVAVPNSDPKQVAVMFSSEPGMDSALIDTVFQLDL